MSTSISFPTIPCVERLPASLAPGNLIRISGTVTSSATCFAINLQNGFSTDPRSDISLHLSPVFSSPPRVVRNSLENQNWGPEESHGAHFPFASEEDFEVLLLAESDHFKIAVNGQHFTEFQYRLPLESISHIAIDGDVTIKEIKFEGLAKSPISSGAGEEVTEPLGFVIEPKIEASVAAQVSGRPHSPYNSPSLPYPPNPSFGPPNPYLQSPSENPYGPPPQGNMYPSGRVSPSPYGPPPGAASPYGPPQGGYPYSPTHGYPQPGTQGCPQQQGSYPQGYPQQQGSYPQGYPQQQGSYPQGYPQQQGSYPQGYPQPQGSYPQGYPQPQGSYPQGYPQSQGSYPGYPYPSQTGPYPGASVYPGQEKKKDGFDLGPLAAAGAAALAGAAGSSLLGHKKHKKNKHGHGIPGMSGAGPASLISGVGSLLSGGHGGHGTKHGSSGGIPMGGVLAGGATALAGAYMLNKSPIGKMMKPKKMKKMYKGGWGSSSSSSSSSD